MVRLIGEVVYKKLFDEAGNELVLPVSSSVRGCLVVLTANYSCVSNVPTIVPFTAADIFDTDAIHDGAGGTPSRMTVPAGVNFVRMSACATWETLGSAGTRYTYIYKGGVKFAGYPGATSNIGLAAAANAIETSYNVVSGIVPVVAGEYFELLVLQARGGNLNLIPDGTWICMEILG